MKACALTTIDNPWNPFTNFRDWYNYDEAHDYGSCSIVDRLSHTTDDMTLVEEAKEIERAILSFVEADPTGLYIAVYDSEDLDLTPLEYDANDSINELILAGT